MNLGGICFLHKVFCLEKHTNLNSLHSFYTMNLIEPLSPEITKEMPPSVAFSLTLFIGAVLGGVYLIEEIRRWKSLETRVTELEETCHETTVLQDSQAETLQEYDQRIREKKDYDSSEELEQDKYQAWYGLFKDMGDKVEIHIYREKCSTIQKNLDWVAWDKTPNASTVVRDFYLGNSHPDFSWNVQEIEDHISGTVSETLVNGWDSIIKIRITTLFSKKSLLQFVHQEEYCGNTSWNLVLKTMIDKNLIEWSRILIDV